MFSRIKSFVCRHRKKFIISGVIIGGSVLLTRYAHKKFIEWQDKETKDFLERTRIQYQFENTERTCNQTILSLASQLKNEIIKALDSESLLAKLRSIEKDQKLYVWEELKIITIARHAALLYCGLMLSVVIRVQVNIMAGGMARNLHNRPESSVQEDYLSLCQHFIQSGCKEVCKIVERHVRNVCNKISLKSKITLNDMEHMFWSIQAGISDDEFDPLRNLPKYLFAKVSSDDLGDLSQQVKNLFMHTVKILEKEEVSSLGESCVGRAFTNSLDTLAEYFVSYHENEVSFTQPSTSTSNGPVMMNGRLTHPISVNIPVAKIIPIIHGLTNAQSKNSEAETWIYQFLIMDKVSVLGKDVFDSFAYASK